MSYKETVKKKTSFLIGLALLGLSVFLLVSSISYIFTWKEDQSLKAVASMFPEAMQASNRAGGLGYFAGEFLVGSCFGIAAVVFGLTLLYAAFKFLFIKKINYLKLVSCALVGSLLGSLILSYVALLVGGQSQLFLGHGIGGGAGAYLVGVMSLLVGKEVCAVVIVLLGLGLACLLFDNFPPEIKVHKKSRKTDEADGKAVSDELSAPEAAAEPPVAVETVPVWTMPQATKPVPAVPAAPTEEPADDGPDVIVTGPEDELSTDIEEDLPQLDIRSDVKRYKSPSLELLNDYADKRFTLPKEEVDRNITKIKTTLASFKIPIDSISASVGYTVTLYKISLGEGVRVNQVKLLEDDIAIKIGIKGVRVVMLADAVGIEVPNDIPSVVPLKAILNSEAFRNVKAELPVALGYTITTKAKVFDLADAPHLLVAGATKQGKSVGLNAIIASLLYAKHPTELKFVFIDPKMVEFQQYSKLFKHYLAALPAAEDEQAEAQDAIVKDPKSADAVLRSLCIEMDERYKLLAAAGVNKITDYNEKYSNRLLLPTEGHKFLPYLVVVIDEYADLTKSTFGNDRNLSRSIENSIIRLAAKGRAAGLHVIIATQRPSVDVITGTIKSNFPTRLAFRTASRQDSQTILGITGAEKLIGKGDMLFFAGADAERVQCALIGTSEIDSLTSFIASQTGFRQSCGQPYYLPDPGDDEGGEGGTEGGLVDMKNIDPLFEEVARLAVMNRSISTSMVQRKMQLGFARAGRIMDQLEAAGIVGPQQGSKPREALVPDYASLQQILDAYIK